MADLKKAIGGRGTTGLPGLDSNLFLGYFKIQKSVEKDKKRY